MKKLIISLMAMMILLTGCAALNETTELELEVSSRLSVLSLERGESVDITDDDAIESITAELNKHTFFKDTETPGGDNLCYEFASGYIITWYNDDGNHMNTVTVLDGKRIYYGNYFYDKEDCKCLIDTSLLETLFIK